MRTSSPVSPRRLQPADATRTSDRLLLSCGAAFVVLILLGNSLTESVLDPEVGAGPAQTRRDLAAQATSAVVRLGLGLELAGLTCLLGFAVGVLLLGGRRQGVGPAGVLTVVGATTMVAVKLASAAPALAALGQHDTLSAHVLHALVQTNEAAFVLCWLPFGVFVLGAARALVGGGAIGRVLGGLGLALGALTVVTGLVGSVAPAYAVPVPFLLSLLWTLAASVRLTALAVRGTLAAELGDHY